MQSRAGTVRVRGALLAGGQSRRMGRDKAAVVIDESTGETLGARVLAALAAVCDDVVVLGHGRGLPASLPRLEDGVADAGPAGGLVALLERGGAERFLVVAVDMPGVDADVLVPLLGALDHHPDALAAVYSQGEPDGPVATPLPVALRGGVRGGARDVVSPAVALGERRLGQLIGALSPARLPIPRRRSHENINTVEDLQAWRDWSGGQRPR